MVEIRIARDFGVGQNERASVFIESASFHIACRGLGFSPDYSALRSILDRSCNLLHLGLFRAVQGERPTELPPIFAGYTLFDKVGQLVTDAIGRKREVDADVKSELIARMIEHAVVETPDRVVLMSSSHELAAPLHVLRERQISTTVIASEKTITLDHPLYKAADVLVPLESIRSMIERETTIKQALAFTPRYA